MVKLDLKDRKILYELDLNSRESLTQIGKKVGLSKDLVSYRIKRMQEDGVIKKFWTAINTFKLGYNVFRIYITFQYVSLDVKNEIIQHFVNYKNAWAVITSKGEIDLAIILWVKDNYEFYQFWEKILDKYEDYFAKYTVSIYIQAVCYKKFFLLGDGYEQAGEKLYETTCGGKPVEIDDVDYQLLNELAVNARVPFIELAEKLDCSSQMVNYRLKNLIKNGIIQAFRVDVDLSKLGLQMFKVDIYLKEHRYRMPIVQYLNNKTYMDCLNVAVGWCDIEPEIVVENMNKLVSVMEEIDAKFPGAIRKQAFWITDKVYKDRWLPEL